MKIDSYAIGMESARSYQASSSRITGFRIKENRGESGNGSFRLNTTVGGEPGNAGDAQGQGETVGDRKGRGGNRTADGAYDTGDEKRDEKIAPMEAWRSRFPMSVSRSNIRSTESQVYEDFRQQVIRYIFEMLFGRGKNRYREVQEQQNTAASSPRTSATATGVSAASTTNSTANVGANSLSVTMMNGTGVNRISLQLTEESYLYEKEEVAFRTDGVVRTSDGREIDFGVNIQMSREFEAYYREDVEFARFGLCDPLVINLDVPVAKMEDQTFYFDIDADGEQDEISSLSAGSGYLALDRNEDGIINDGSELFGTKSGNGFEDLAQYDLDNNGWIDENDAVWDKLKIWTKDENGQDVLYTLAQKGVGAICLKNVSTDYTMQGNTGQTTGVMRSTGVFLYENGNVGTVQHVDVARYYKEA